MSTIRPTLLVGAYHRPPARQIINHLPSGTKLSFLPEPENPYDASAVKVMLDPASIPLDQHEALALALEGTGFVLSDLLEPEVDGANLAAEPIFLGYVAKTGGKPLAGTDYAGNQEWAEELGSAGVTWEDAKGTLGFSPEGKPTITLELS